MPDVTNLNVNVHEQDDWLVVDHPDPNEWVEISRDDGNRDVLREAMVVPQDDAQRPDRVVEQLPDGPAAEQRAQARRQAAFDANRSDFAIRAMQAKIDELPVSEEIRQSLKVVTTGVLRKNERQDQLRQMASVNDLEPVLANLLEKETQHLNQMNLLLRTVRQTEAVNVLVEGFGVSEEDVERMGGAELNQTLSEVRDRCLIEAERDPETGALSQAEFGKAYRECLNEVTQYAKSRVALFEAIQAAGLKPEEAESLRWEALTLSSPVVDALKTFLTGGSSREALKTAVGQLVGDVSSSDCDMPRLMSEVDLQPKSKVAGREAVRILKLALAERHALDVLDFSRNAVNDAALSAALGLPALMKAKQPFTEAVRRDLVERLAVLKSGAEKMRAAVNELKQRPEYRQAPGEFWDAVFLLTQRQIQEGRVADADIEALQTQVSKLLRGETDFGVMLEIAQSRHPDWTEDQKTLFSESLKYLHHVMPHAPLKAYSLRVIRLEQMVDYNDTNGLLNRKDSLPQQLAILKALMLMGTGYPLYTSLIQENKEELAHLFEQKHGQPSINEVLQTVIGPEVEIGPKESLRDLCNAIQEQCDWKMCKTLRARWPQCEAIYEKVLQAERSKHRNRSEAGLALETLNRLPNVSPDWEIFQNIRLQDGIKPLVAVEKFFGAQAIDLADFVEIPKITLKSAGDKDDAEEQFLKDFHRCALPGNTTFEVKAPQGVVKVNDASNDLPSPEDLQRFISSEVSSKSLALLKALEDLCAGNDMQYRLALQTLSQGGILLMTTLLEGPKAEVPLAYHVAKDDQGNLIISAKSSREQGATQLKATVVIHPNGTAEYTELHVAWRELLSKGGWVEMSNNFKPAPLRRM